MKPLIVDFPLPSQMKRHRLSKQSTCSPQLALREIFHSRWPEQQGTAESSARCSQKHISYIKTRFFLLNICHYPQKHHSAILSDNLQSNYSRSNDCLQHKAHRMYSTAASNWTKTNKKHSLTHGEKYLFSYTYIYDNISIFERKLLDKFKYLSLTRTEKSIFLFKIINIQHWFLSCVRQWNNLVQTWTFRESI